MVAVKSILIVFVDIVLPNIVATRKGVANDVLNIILVSTVDDSSWTRKPALFSSLILNLKKMGNRNNQKNNKNSKFCNSLPNNSTIVTSLKVGMVCSISTPKMSRDCKCELCVADKKVEEFFTKKRYWWNNRWLCVTST